MSEWISVKDRLPEDGQNCNVAILGILNGVQEYYVESGEFSTRLNAWYYAEREYIHYPRVGTFGVTHWMPTPEPPEVSHD